MTSDEGHQQELEARRYGEETMTNELAKALAAAQVEMQNPGFDSQNPHFKNRFASLAAVRNAVVPVLSKHGIAMTQDISVHPFQEMLGILCSTSLTHQSGQRMVFGPLWMPASKPDAQGLGSAATYARRYQLMAVCGVVGDADDDAEAAVGRDAPGSKVNPRGDEVKEVPVARARELATQMRGVLESDAEEAVIGLKVLDLHDKLNKHQDEYIAAADQLTSKERRAWKDLMAIGKTHQDKPLAANGRA